MLRERLRAPFLDVRCQDSQFFSVLHVRQRRERRVRRFVRGNAGRCIRRELRRLDRVRWAWVREREWHLRDQFVRGRVRELRRGVRASDMCREA